MRRLWLILSLLVLAAGPAAHAQVASPVDSSAFRARQLIAPGLLLTGGVAIHCFGHDAIDVPYSRWTQEKWRKGHPERHFDDYIQYVPIVADLGMGLLGVPAEHGFVDRTIEAAMGCLMLGSVSLAMKELIYSPRPNGLDINSFPSGHADLTFMGAEFVRLEYGWGWGAGAYTVAATVAVMRNYNNWHWLSDCLAGAGLGILAADMAHWLLEPTKRLLGLRTGSWGNGRPAVQASVQPTVDPLSGTVCTTLALRF